MSQFDDTMVNITLRKDEAEIIGTLRCGCGHLRGLHNTHDSCACCLVSENLDGFFDREQCVCD